MLAPRRQAYPPSFPITFPILPCAGGVPGGRACINGTRDKGTEMEKAWLDLYVVTQPLKL
eukprot:659971-Pelagomonas_calceolata.AAC.5